MTNATSVVTSSFSSRIGGGAATQIPVTAVLAVALSAAVVFAIEPFTGKVLLPRLGGGPSVWNTCILMFQILLLAGYGYTVILARVADLRKGVAYHAALVATSIALWPFAVRALWLTPSSGWPPVAWIAMTTTAGIGLPFAILAATSPLLQVWLARASGAPPNVHRLYAASNIASLLGLALYVGVLEPLVGARRQSLVLWLCYAGATILSLLVLRRVIASDRPAATAAPAPAPVEDPVSGRSRGQWIALSFGASLCLYAVTTYIATDVGSFPLLWCLPLGVFLGAFAAGFSAIAERLRRWLVRLALLAALAALAHLVVVEDSRTVWVRLLAPLLALGCLVAALAAELAHRRPSDHRLAGYYALIGVGGVLAGVGCVILLPWAWSSVSLPAVSILSKPLQALGLHSPVFVTESVPEYPAALVLSAVLLSSWASGRSAWRVAIGTAVGVAVASLGARTPAIEEALRGSRGVVEAAVACALVAAPRGTRMLAGILTLSLAGGLLQTPPNERLFEARNFFGTSRVEVDGDLHMLKHGTTLHGIQPTGEDRDKPASYYTWASPLGRVMEHLRPRTVMAVGLGVGTVAAYGRAGDRYQFLEINSLVRRIATNPDWFTYVTAAQARGVDLRVAIGDGRLLAAAATDGAWDLVIVDAFSSDAIPVHLLSVEAVETFERKLTRGGVIAYHISNRFFDLQPVVAAAADRLGLSWAVQEREGPTNTDYGSKWVMLATSPASAEAAGLTEAGWQHPVIDARRAPWTDDWANVLGTMRSWRFWEADE